MDQATSSLLRTGGMFGALMALFMVFAPSPASALNCHATVTDVDFGSPDILSSNATEALATITVTCTALPFFEIVKMCPSIDEGTGGSSGQTRFMTGPGRKTQLAYGLYQDAAHTIPWGSVTNPELGTVPAIILSTATGTAVATQTLYARLPGGQTAVPPGQYNSGFQGAEAAFTWSPYLFVASPDCTGFLGRQVTHPNFDVIASPAAGCTLATADMTFPNTGVLDHVVDGQTTLGVTCAQGLPYSISLNDGQSGNSPTARRMKSGAGDLVTYALYRDSGRTLPWGEASSEQGASEIGLGTEQAYPVYGRVPIQETPQPGTYTDTVVVTVAY